MQRSNEVNNLIPIDETMMLQSIMGMEEMNNPPNNLNNLKEIISPQEKRGKKKRVPAKKKAIPPIPPMIPANPVNPPTVTVPVVNDKETIIMKILKYQNSTRFGEYITKDLKIKYTREQLVKMSVDRVESVLHRIRINLNNRNVDTMFDGMIKTCAFGYENAVSQFYNISGFTDLLWANPGFHDAVERYKCEANMPDIPPGVQLAYIVATTTLAAHSINKMNIENLPKPEFKENLAKPEKKSKKDVDKKQKFELGQQI